MLTAKSHQTEAIEDCFSDADHEAITVPLSRRETNAALATLHRRPTVKVDVFEVQAMAEAADAAARRAQ